MEKSGKTVVRRIALCGLVVWLAIMGFLAQRFYYQANPPAFGATVAVRADGTVAVVGPDVVLYKGTRVQVGALRSVVEEQESWLARSRLPPSASAAEHDALVDALLDLHTLDADGVVVAGWPDRWRYVWPRDSAFVASALARTGHADDAVRQLLFLQKVQPSDGEFEARYRPDGSGPPDDRGVQLDGAGWALWALDEVMAAQPDDAARRTTFTELADLYTRSTRSILSTTSDGTRLPRATADYWETKEDDVTLATCAAMIMGLRSAASTARRVGDARRAAFDAAADRLQVQVLATFGAHGYPRHPGGSRSSVDLGVSLLMPPFAGVRDDSVLVAWTRSPSSMRRPAGGLAPGGSWRRDGISWTPTTLTYAMVAVCAQHGEEAASSLAWATAHRTTMGSIPEKVLADGAPAGPAPLAWSAAAFIIASDLRARGCGSPAG